MNELQWDRTLWINFNHWCLAVQHLCIKAARRELVNELHFDEMMKTYLDVERVKKVTNVDIAVSVISGLFPFDKVDFIIGIAT